MANSRLGKNGHEVLDSTPVAMPVGYERPLTLDEKLRAAIRTSLSDYAHSCIS